MMDRRLFFGSIFTPFFPIFKRKEPDFKQIEVKEPKQFYLVRSFSDYGYLMDIVVVSEFDQKMKQFSKGKMITISNNLHNITIDSGVNRLVRSQDLIRLLHRRSIGEPCYGTTSIESGISISEAIQKHLDTYYKEGCFQYGPTEIQTPIFLSD